MKEIIGQILAYITYALALFGALRSIYISIKAKNWILCFLVILSVLICSSSLVVLSIYRLDKRPPAIFEVSLMAFTLSFILIIVFGYLAERKYRKAKQLITKKKAIKSQATEDKGAEIFDRVMEKWDKKCLAIPNRSAAKERQALLDIVSGLSKEERKRFQDEALSGKDSEIGVDAAVQTLFRYYCENGDRKNAVKLLSLRCPGMIYRDWIEFYLVNKCRNHLKNGYQLLFDAYRMASGKNKKLIACIIRHSLAGNGIEDPNNASLVAKAEEWYKENADKITPNPRYMSELRRKTVLFGKEKVKLFFRK